MIKLVVLAFLLYIAYRVFSEKPQISEGNRKHLHDQEPDDEDFTDYEEID